MASTEEKPPSPTEGEVEVGEQGDPSSPLPEEKEEKSGPDGGEGQKRQGGQAEREESVGDSGGVQAEVKEEALKSVGSEGTREEEEEEEEVTEYRSHRRQHGVTGGSSSEEDEDWHSTEQGDERPHAEVEPAEEEVNQDDSEEKQEEEEEEEEKEKEEKEDDGGWEERGSSLGAEDGVKEEEEEEEKLPKDNPMFVPRGKYFHHDNRECEEAEEEQPSSQKTPSRSEVVDKWEHDLYIPEEQAPRTPQEKERDQRYYDNLDRRREHQRSGDRENRRGRRGVQLGQYLSREQNEWQQHRERDRRREVRWGERERGRGGRGGEGRSSYGYGGADDQRQRAGDRRGQERRRDRGEMSRGKRKGEEERPERGERSRENSSLVVPSTEHWDDEPATESPQSTGKSSASPPTQSKGHRSLFRQDPSAPMPTRVFTLGRRSELIVKDLPSPSARSEGSPRRPLGIIGRGRGRGRGGRYIHQTSPGGAAATSAGVKEIAPFAASSITTVPSSSKHSHPVSQPSPSQPVTPTTQPTPSFRPESVPDSSKNEASPTPEEETSTSQEKNSSPVHEQDPNPDKTSPPQQTSILGSPPVSTETVKPKRYSSRRQKGTGAPLTAIPTKEQVTGAQDGPSSMVLPPGGPWMGPHPQMVTLDPAAYQQHAMFAAMMQNPMMAAQFMLYQQQLQLMHGYPQPAAPGGPIVDQYLEHSSSPQVAAYPPSQPPLPPPPPVPPPQDVAKHPSPDAPGLFIPGIDPDQQRLMQAQRGVGLSQKPNQAIPIVPPKELDK